MGHFDHDHNHGQGEHVHEHTHTDENGQVYTHAKELGDMAEQFDGEVRHQLLHAVESFDQANGYLSAALEELKK